MTSFIVERPKGEVCIRAVHVASGKHIGFSHLAHRTLKDVRQIMDAACQNAAEAVAAFDEGTFTPEHARALQQAIRKAGGHI